MPVRSTPVSTLEGEVAGGNRGVPLADHEPLGHISQLSYIAGPSVFTERGFSGFGDPRNRCAVRLAHALQVVVEERYHVIAPLAKRRDANLDHVQAIVEILTKCACLDLCGQIAIGRRDEANIAGGGRSLRADGVNLATLGEPEQHRLHAQTHLSQFVQKEGSAVRLTDQSGLVAVRPGEAATHMPEQLRFEQRFRNAAAIDGDERT